MNYLILKQRQGQKLLLDLCFTLVQKDRKEQRKGEEKDDVVVLSRILDGSRMFGILSMMNDLKLVQNIKRNI